MKNNSGSVFGKPMGAELFHISAVLLNAKVIIFHILPDGK
jgi:hypothetical protein